MFDEWLVSRLSKNAWALLGALLLLRRVESNLKNYELALRSGLNKNNLGPAKEELIVKGLITVLSSPGQPSLIRLNIPLEGFGNEQDQGMVKEVGALARPSAPQIQGGDVLKPILDAWAVAFPDHELSRGTAQRMYKAVGEKADKVVDIIGYAVDYKPSNPAGYVLSLCRKGDVTLSDQPSKIDEPLPPTQEMVEFTQRAREYASKQHVRPISERRARSERQSTTS